MLKQSLNKINWVLLLLSGSFILVLQSDLLLLCGHLFALKLNLALQFLLLLFFLGWSFQSTGSLFNAPAIFLVSLYYWNAAWFFCHYFQISPLFQLTGRVFHYGADDIPQAIALISLCLSCTVAGVVLGFDRQKKMFGRIKAPLGEGDQFSVLSRRIVLFSLLAYAALTFTFLFKIAIGFFHERYSEAFYLIQPQDSFLYRLYESTKFFSIVLIITSLAYLKKVERVYILALILALIIVQFLWGARIIPFTTMIALIVCADHFIKRQSWKTLLVFLAGVAFLSCVVSYARHWVGLGWDVFNLAPSQHTINLWGFIWDAQQGGIVARTIHFISQDGGFFYGRSILDSLIYLLPRFVVDGLGFHTGFVAPNDWIVQHSLDIAPGGGLGFSLVAEAYFNFGMTGCLLFFLIGWVIGNNYFKYVFFKNKYVLLHVLNFSLVLALNMHSIIGSYMRYLVYGFLFIETLRMVDKRECK